MYFSCFFLFIQKCYHTATLSSYCEIYFLLFTYLFNFKWFYVFWERATKVEREGAKHQCARETSIGCLLRAPQLGTWPTTQACALTGNQNRRSFGPRDVQSTEPHQSGLLSSFWCWILIIFRSFLQYYNWK